MADPASIIAIAGLAFMGKKLSDPKPEKYTNKVKPTEAPAPFLPAYPEEVPNIYSPKPNEIEGWHGRPQPKIEHNNFGDIVPQVRSSGNELLDMRNRMFDNGRMNNLSPIQKQLVGPGIGVGPEIPAAGGFQQLVRVNPENVGAYKLTTLPGRSGPAFDIFGGRRGKMGELSNNRPEKTAHLPSRRPAVGGRSQGFGGRVLRGAHVNGSRLTNRSQTGSRDDGLGFPGAKRIVSNLTAVSNPTRNKRDGNLEQYVYNNQIAPNVSKYSHGYVVSPGVAIGSSEPHSTEKLFQYGFRPDDRRGKASRAGNAGRMNVRAGPLNQGGMVTNMRSDTSRTDGHIGPLNGGWTQQYVNEMYHKFNAYKGNINPNASPSSLNIAKQQNDNNPIAQKGF
jgi:hypothetical protein